MNVTTAARPRGAILQFTRLKLVASPHRQPDNWPFESVSKAALLALTEREIGAIEAAITATLRYIGRSAS